MSKVSPEPQENEIDHIVSNIAYNLEDDNSSIEPDSKSEACSSKEDPQTKQSSGYESEKDALNSSNTGFDRDNFENSTLLM